MSKAGHEAMVAANSNTEQSYARQSWTNLFGYAALDALDSCLDLPWRIAGNTAMALGKVFGPRADAVVGILTYHRVAPCSPGLPKPHYNVTPKRFRQQS